MQPQPLSAFWQRLTAFQRLSLISLLFFLLVLPVGLWLAMSPTSPFSRAGSGPAILPIPIESPPPLPSIGFPTGTIEGPTSGIAGEIIGPYTATGKGENLQWIRIYWAKADSDLSNPASWNLAGEENKNNCVKLGTDSCTTAPFTPKEAGTYYVVVNVNSDFNGEARPCSGNPYIEGATDPDTSPVPGWVDCGPGSRINVEVMAPVTSEQTFILHKGYNFVGITFSKDKYTAEDFLNDLNSTFEPDDIVTTQATQQVKNPVKYIFGYDAVNRSWQTHKLGSTTDDNFPIKHWAGYLVYASQSGSSKISTKPAGIKMDFVVNTGWLLVSTPVAPPKPYNSAKALLELAQSQGIDVTSIWRWDPVQKKYDGYRKDTGGTDFPIVTGVAYWIYNNGIAGTLVYPVPLPEVTPIPSSPLPSSIPLPPIPQ